MALYQFLIGDTLAAPHLLQASLFDERFQPDESRSLTFPLILLSLVSPSVTLAAITAGEKTPNLDTFPIRRSPRVALQRRRYCTQRGSPREEQWGKKIVRKRGAVLARVSREMETEGAKESHRERPICTQGAKQKKRTEHRWGRSFHGKHFYLYREQ